MVSTTAVSGAIKIESETYRDATNRTCATGTTISGGTLLSLTDPNTVAANGAKGQAFGGIAVSDKIADDGHTTIGAHMSGTFDLWSAGTAITAGKAVAMSGANLVCEAIAGELLSGAIVGIAEETAAVGVGEQIRVRLRG